MHTSDITQAGKKIEEAKKALIMLHGRGAAAQDILSLAPYLNVKDFALFAPQATNRTWYPLSFLAPLTQNEPWLTSSISLLETLVKEIVASGIPMEKIFFLGFSQGACLALEFTARHATRWGGVVAFTGGLIGDKIYEEHYQGDFAGTPVFIGTSDPDSHVPVNRVYDSMNILKKLNAAVTVQVYPHMGHTVTPEEIDQANTLVFT